MSAESRIGVLTASIAAVMLPICHPVEAGAQVRVASSFTTGGRDLLTLNLAATSVGEFPAILTPKDGSMVVVLRDGQHMLRASTRSSFLVQLPEVLPQDFTVEVDLVPKTCCQPEDIAIEGTRDINQGYSSANVLWHRTNLMVIGGAPSNYHALMPETLAASLPGALTRIVLAMRGDEMRLYTNGQLLFTLPDRKFVRGCEFRVFLGGQNDSERAVYLAGLRVIANSPPAGPVATVSGAAALSGVATGKDPVTSTSGLATGKDPVTSTDASGVATGKEPATTSTSGVATGKEPVTTSASGLATGKEPATTSTSGVATGKEPVTTSTSGLATGKEPVTSTSGLATGKEPVSPTSGLATGKPLPASATGCAVRKP